MTMETRKIDDITCDYCGIHCGSVDAETNVIVEGGWWFNTLTERHACRVCVKYKDDD